MQRIDGIIFSEMIKSGAAELRKHENEVNDLNVFPIPDGDTGSNMLLTVMGGARKSEAQKRLCDASESIAKGMLLSARGNSGVILSQFIEGIKNGFASLDDAGAEELSEAFKKGVEQAYEAVMTPTEGTVLTVIREAADYADGIHPRSPEEYLVSFIDEAKRSLARTPLLLPVLKQAGVVDSGAAGLIYVLEGMLKSIRGEAVTYVASYAAEKAEEPDLDLFGENDVLTFGYCTELLIRLQNSKTDIDSFDEKAVTDFLSGVGDSVVTVRSGSILKLHVHTFTPHKVLEFCQSFGEFLKVKIENMTLQHSALRENEEKEQTTEIYRVEAQSERKKFGVVAVASGAGLKQTFIDLGADVVVDGGQSANPSAEEIIEAIESVNADTVFLLPNNGNVTLTARQAAEMYTKSDVRVVESHTVGEGYAALSMYDTGSEDADEIYAELCEAMEDVLTAEVSKSVRDTEYGDGTVIRKGDYIGFVGKDIIAVSGSREAVLKTLAQKLISSRYGICILIEGSDASPTETASFERYFTANYRGKELYTVRGDQDIYDYIMILE